MQVYDPREDTELIRKHILRFSTGLVLDMGTGSGVLAKQAAHTAEKVIAVDVNKKALNIAKKNCAKYPNIVFRQSDLFSNVKEKFDLIIFNPPYLPDDAEVKDIALDGGKKGYEVVERFLNKANDYLKKDGKILIVFSSLTKRKKIEEIIEKNCMDFHLLDKKGLFFEELYVYLIVKKKLLKELEKKGVKNVNYFTHGHRGVLYKAKYKGKDIVIKTENPKSFAKGRILNEINYLKILNKKKIGPKVLFFGENYFAYEYIPGEFIGKWVEKKKKKEIIKMLKQVFEQMYVMDKMGINKEEMHHPVKHVIINGKPVLVDFERANKTKKPKNVTQFCQFLIASAFGNKLKEKKIEIDKKTMISFAKEYKKEMNKKNYEKILEIIK